MLERKVDAHDQVERDGRPGRELDDLEAVAERAAPRGVPPDPEAYELEHIARQDRPVDEDPRGPPAADEGGRAEHEAGERRTPRHPKATAGRTGLRTWRDDAAGQGAPGQARYGLAAGCQRVRNSAIFLGLWPWPSSSSPESSVWSLLPFESRTTRTGRPIRWDSRSARPRRRCGPRRCACSRPRPRGRNGRPGSWTPWGPSRAFCGACGTRCTSLHRRRGRPSCAPPRPVARAAAICAVPSAWTS
jgi:hypothetical protein